MAAAVGLYGKHPGYGDFVREGLSEATVETLGQWLDKRLSGIKDDLGNRWGPFWDDAQEIRFWIGRAVLGRTLCGVFKPSEDKVGRRYPLILALEGARVAAPVQDSDQTLYDAMSAALAAAKPGKGAAALLADLPAAVTGVEAEDEAEAALGPVLWAHHPEDKLSALLAATAAEDARRAVVARSYWWAPATGERHPSWLGLPGLPDADALAWILDGVRADRSATALPHIPPPVPDPIPEPAPVPAPARTVPAAIAPDGAPKPGAAATDAPEPATSVPADEPGDADLPRPPAVSDDRTIPVEDLKIDRG